MAGELRKKARVVKALANNLSFNLLEGIRKGSLRKVPIWNKNRVPAKHRGNVKKLMKNQSGKQRKTSTSLLLEEGKALHHVGRRTRP
jgi:hypothetical protein